MSLELRGVTAGYGAGDVLHEVSLDVRDGDGVGACGHAVREPRARRP